jgi:hypothetical protein
MLPTTLSSAAASSPASSTACGIGHSSANGRLYVVM